MEQEWSRSLKNVTPLISGRRMDCGFVSVVNEERVNSVFITEAYLSVMKTLLPQEHI